MAILKKNAFSRRVPDLVTEELVAVLSRRSSFEFKQLFDIVHENLRARNAASGCCPVYDVDKCVRSEAA